jgi:large subunit ribosomal protein L24e
MFTGRKIYPSKGKIFVRGDSKIFRFVNGKSESLFLQRKNPRRIAWTVLYRRQHKKGISEVRHLHPSDDLLSPIVQELEANG